MNQEFALHGHDLFGEVVKPRAYAQGQLFEPTQPKPEQQEIAA